MRHHSESDRVLESVPSPGSDHPMAAPGANNRESRRLFLRRAATTTAVGTMGLGLTASSQIQAGTPRKKVMRVGGLAVTASGGLPNHPPDWLQSNFVEIFNDEAAHVAILSDLLKFDNIPIRPTPHLHRLEQPTLLAFVQNAVAFENKS